MKFSIGPSAERVLEMVKKEFRQLMRDPKLARVIMIAPVIQLIIFGYAVSTDLRSAATVVVDHDRSVASREFVAALTASGYFAVVGRSERPADLVRALDRGEALVGIEIPARFAESLHRGTSAPVQVLVDGTNSNSATVALGYAERIAVEFGARVAPSQAGGGIDLRARAWFNPELSSRNYNVPAVVGAIILLVCLLLTSLAVVREREIGTLEQLMVSPLTARELIAGKTIPFAIIGLIDLAVVTVVALAWFGVGFAQESIAILEQSQTSSGGLPTYPGKMMIPIAGALLLLQGLGEIARCVMCIRTGEWPQRLHDVEEVDIEELKASIAQSGSTGVTR